MNNTIDYILQIDNHKKKDFIDALHYCLDCLKSNNYYDSDIKNKSETISWRAFTYGEEIYEFLIKLMKKMLIDDENNWLLDNQQVEHQNYKNESMMNSLLNSSECSTIYNSNNQNIDIPINGYAFVNCNDNNDISLSDYLNLNYSDKEPTLAFLNNEDNETDIVDNEYIIMKYTGSLQNFDNPDKNLRDKLSLNFVTKLTPDAERIIIHHDSRSFKSKYNIEEFDPIQNDETMSTDNCDDSWTQLNTNCLLNINSDNHDETNLDQFIEESVAQRPEDDYQENMDKSFEINSADDELIPDVNQNYEETLIKLNTHCLVQINTDNVEKTLERIEENKRKKIEDNYQQVLDTTCKIDSDKLTLDINDNYEEPLIKLNARCSVQLKSDDVERALEWIEKNKTKKKEDDYQEELDTQCRINSDELTQEVIQNYEDPWNKLKVPCSVQLKSDDVGKPLECIEDNKTDKMDVEYKEESDMTSYELNSNKLTTPKTTGVQQFKLIDDLVYVKCLEHKNKNKKLEDELIRQWAREIKKTIKNSKSFNPTIEWTNNFKKYYNITGDKKNLKVNYNSQSIKHESSSIDSTDESAYRSFQINNKDDDVYVYYNDSITQEDDGDDYYYSLKKKRYSTRIKKTKKNNTSRSRESKRLKYLPQTHGYNLRNNKQKINQIKIED